MLVPLLAIAVGLVVLVWSSDRFVEGAAALATSMGVSQLLVGMIVVGFGTSLPEMMVSALASVQGTPGIALGNAYGSNIANITLILGVTAVMNPIPVRSTILRRELPLLMAVTLFAAVQLGWNYSLNRVDGILLLVGFGIVMYLTVRQNAAQTNDPLEQEVDEEMAAKPALSRAKAMTWVVIGLVLLMASSRALVWGAVETARQLGVSDLIIGLTIVAVGTSLPELASSIAAARKNHHDIAVGNIIGSNIFNTMVVVGIAATIKPLLVAPELLSRDMLYVGLATIALYLVCMRRGGKAPIITRTEGVCLIGMFVLYNIWIATSAIGPAVA